MGIGPAVGHPCRTPIAPGIGRHGSLVLVVSGGVLVLVGGLVLADLITPSAPVDEHALRWHVFVWDLWFLLWGMALRLAA